MELAPRVRSVTALSLPGLSSSYQREIRAFPLCLWPAEGGCHVILQQSMTYLEAALDKVLDPGTITDVGRSPTHCHLQTQATQAGKQAMLASLWQGGM